MDLIPPKFVEVEVEDVEVLLVNGHKQEWYTIRRDLGESVEVDDAMIRIVRCEAATPQSFEIVRSAVVMLARRKRVVKVKERVEPTLPGTL